MNLRTYRADALMLITALIWGTTFVAQSLGMAHIGPFLYTGLRFALGSLVILPLVLLARPQTDQAGRRFSKPMLLGSIALGAVLTLGINLQQVGLLFTTVTNSGFITGLYVILVPLFGLLLGLRNGLGTWCGACLAVVGMLLLSINADYRIAFGDLLQLAGAACWAVHVLLVGVLATRYDAIRVSFIQFSVCAVISLFLALLLEDIELNAIRLAMPAILYGGLLAVGIGFTLQVVAQKNAVASHAAIILSLEAVFAALAGWLVLNETLSLRGFIGCCLMLTGMLVAQLVPIYRQHRHSRAAVQQEPAGHH
ncbi:Threonine/homoserine efflux transporter RhtA [Halopseudomonas litoralis]|uniref:Threonine/homoserine efflux transporter RhtA n=1 Tax=Halopseudomonas litoralis TaxID=797277 RepID=A0A1H1MB07_9GAMM|nr:DMT family transporter [Halopseudomonas litoralis]SDR83565.1 Threonine/homoserine efflux transporter RhtA [Halopseudomonas litoralis]